MYNQCWEDPRLDRIAFAIKPTDNILVLTSAGCNVLDYLLDNPNRIDAVDMNPRQNALLELKKAGIKSLDFSDFFAFFGMGLHFGAERIYQSALRPQLPPFAQHFWDKHIDFFKPSQWNSGFYFRGTSGWVARLIGQYINMRGLHSPVQKAFAAQNLKEQTDIYTHELKPYFWNKAMRWVTRRGATMAALGVPRSQFVQIENYYVGGMAKFIEDCLDCVFTKLSLKDNYFYHLYLLGSYSPTCSPEYLNESNFQTLKDRVDRVFTHNSSVLDYLVATDHPLHKATLLDHMDWLYQNHYDVLKKQWGQLIRRSQDQSKIIWRSASPAVDFIDPIELESGKTLGDVLRYDNTLAAHLHSQDRVHTYGSFYVTEVNKA